MSVQSEKRTRRPAVNDDRSFVAKLFLGFVHLTDEFNEALAVQRHTLLRPISELKLSHGPTLAVLCSIHHAPLLSNLPSSTCFDTKKHVTSP